MEIDLYISESWRKRDQSLTKGTKACMTKYCSENRSPYLDVTFWVLTKHGQVLQGRAERKNARRAFARIKSEDADTNVAKDLGKSQQIPQIIVAKHRGSARNDPNRLTIPT
jgi:hypothetical protein